MPRKRKSFISTLPNEPIGILPDGSINIVAVDDPPFQPTVLNNQGEPIDHALVEPEFIFDRPCSKGNRSR